MSEPIKAGVWTVSFGATAILFERHFVERTIQPPFIERIPTRRWTTIFDVLESDEIGRALDLLNRRVEGHSCKFKITIEVSDER